jgi:ABC-type uncharacterized transport systems, ATPase components
VEPERRIDDLSMGERQRVEILKLLARDAGVLILDEPTSVLAPEEILELYALLRRLAADGRAVVFVSHKLEEIGPGRRRGFHTPARSSGGPATWARPRSWTPPNWPGS